MRVWRITKASYRNTVLSGRGSTSRDGGRWNLPGYAAVYLTSTGALALAELLLHLRSGTHAAQAGLAWFGFDVPEGSIARVDTATLPDGWDSLPPKRASQVIGTAFLKAGNHLALEVPSVIVPFESNYLLNPDHPATVGLEPVEEIPVVWDARFFG